MVIPVKLMSWSLAGSSPAVRIFFFAWKWTKWGLLTCVPPSIVPIYIDLHADFQQIFITATGKVGEWLIRSPTKRLPKGSWVRTSFLSFCEHLFFFVWYIWNLSNLTPFSPKKKVHSLPKSPAREYKWWQHEQNERYIAARFRSWELLVMSQMRYRFSTTMMIDRSICWNLEICMWYIYAKNCTP